MRSTRSSSRARRSERRGERGYALISALVLAILYFGLIELLLLDSARELAAARRFRARIIAETLAESGAELAALQLVTNVQAEGNAHDWQGTLRGKMTRNGAQFDIEGEGRTTGITESRAKVIVRGRVVGTTVRIQYTMHTY